MELGGHCVGCQHHLVSEGIAVGMYCVCRIKVDVIVEEVEGVGLYC